MSRFLLALPLVLAACGGPDAAPPFSPETWRGEGAHVEVKIHDMHCEGCERSVKEALGALDEVAAVEADNVTDLVLVTLKGPGGRDAAIARIREALHDQHRLIVGEDEIPTSE